VAALLLQHDLQVMGDHYFPLERPAAATRHAWSATAGTRFDFRESRAIRDDHDFCTKLSGPRGTMKHGLTLRDPASGRRMEVWTTEGCMQTYTAIHWQPQMTGHTGPLHQSHALAIEPQNVADAPNNPAFPSSILRPGEFYRNHMEWRFA
jgi:aldose 1-epimerase